MGIEGIIVLSILLFDKGGLSFQALKEMYFAPIFALLLPFLIIFALQKNVLTLSINESRIAYKYFPFNIKPKPFLWNEIEKVYINKYDALGNYGGWGMRYRLWFKFSDKAYLLNDKSVGLQIEFKNGKRLLFSSNKIDEMGLFLINLKTRYNIQAIQ
ncbi:hypothetical protein ACFOG5_07210 [Pedobacter fastidiosus]|uniref:PH domain-containing protein n=1 Tax=Pedobacter fastidiosus TaxID=2765361 RepID=A0ABR7KWQ8_9SPHI|nr:hypothetical protein [Pedobacter fastidiosus]MBC6112133.1 hypothetical protein [Pedobacter fastidiosus]